MTDPVAQIARAVLYEGYVLWPYRRSALKNRQRWTFGGVHPEGWTRSGHDDDACVMQTQCLAAGGEDATLDVAVRFLHVVDRQVVRRTPAGLEDVDELTVDGERHLSWEEATEREIAAPPLTLAQLRGERVPEAALRVPEAATWPPKAGPAFVSPPEVRPAFASPPEAGPASVSLAIDVPAGDATEPLGAQGAIVRRWEGLAGEVSLSAEAVAPDLHRVTVRIANTTPWQGGDRPAALRRTLVSTHTVLRAGVGAELVSVIDPPEPLRAATEGCQSIGTWPSLVGAPGERHTILSSPIILGDYPQIAPESPGDLFDGGEIDELLILNVLSLTEEEQREARDSDPRVREIIDRCAGLSSQELLRLHGTVRDLRPLRER